MRRAGLLPPRDLHVSHPPRLSPDGLQRRMLAELAHMDEVDSAHHELNALESVRVCAEGLLSVAAPRGRFRIVTLENSVEFKGYSTVL